MLPASYQFPSREDDTDTCTEIEDADSENVVAEICRYFDERGGNISSVTTLLTRTRLEDLEERWPFWRRNADYLLDVGFSIGDISMILDNGYDYFHAISRVHIEPVLRFLAEDLKVPRKQTIRRIIRTVPELLVPRADGSTLKETMEILEDFGFARKRIAERVGQWPWLLTCTPRVVFVVSAFLTSKNVGIKARELGSLFRWAPWLLHEATTTTLSPIIAYLRGEVGIIRMEKLLRRFPQIVTCDLNEDIIPSIKFLRSIGISPEQIPRVVETFPTVLAFDVEEQMQPVVKYFRNVLKISRWDISRMCRAFPSLLGLDIDKQIVPVIKFLKEIGVKNIGYFVVQLPAVLTYSVEEDLEPKYKFLVEEMRLGIRDLCYFPGYLSYPLESVIQARTSFLKKIDKPFRRVGMRVAFVGNDAHFASKIAEVDPETYIRFKEELVANRNSVSSNSTRSRRKQSAALEDDEESS